MIIVKLEGKEYKMPEGWHEVTVGQFQTIVELAAKFTDGEYDTQVEYVLDIFGGITGAPKEDLLKMTRQSFDTLSNKLNWVTDEVIPTQKSNWVLAGEEYIPVKNLDSLSMGDSISLELMIKESNEWNVLGNLLPMLIRKVKKIDDGSGKIKKVPGEFIAEEYEITKKLFLENMMVSDVIQLKSFF